MMRTIVVNMAAIAMLWLTGNASGIDMPPLAKKHGCTNCHSINTRVIGPSWMDISKAYNNNTKTSMGIPVSEILRGKSAEEWLKIRISSGGAGTWGTVMMPPADPGHLWQDKMDKMVKGIMGLSKGSTPREELLKLTNEYSCQACHSMDKKAEDIGPSWMDISRFYNNAMTSPYDGVKAVDVLKARTAEEWMLFKVAHGGLGNWGLMLMPALEYRPIPGQTENNYDKKYSEFQELINFIMGLSKK